jgi:DNA-binding beta-propeller fold protein YncE
MSEVNVRKLRAITLVTLLFVALGVHAQEKAPLVFFQSIPLPALHDGDFDHFTVDLEGHRLFLTAEKNAAVVVFDLQTNKLIHTISDIKEAHSMVYRSDLKKLFVVDGEAAEVKIYDSDSYQRIGSIELKEDADSSTYDSSTQYMYVVNGGEGAHLPYTFISVIDTKANKKLVDIKIDADSIEAMAVEKSGPRLFANLESKSTVAVIDRKKRVVIATWPAGEVAKELVAMAFDEADHRLFVTSKTPAKLIVLDSDSGKVVTSLPCVAKNDDMAYDPGNKRIYISGNDFVDVFQQQDPDHYEQIGHIAGSFRAKTAILVPQLSRYYLAVPRQGGKPAEVRIYQTMP